MLRKPFKLRSLVIQLIASLTKSDTAVTPPRASEGLRPAAPPSLENISLESKTECLVLYEPDHPKFDVVFIHGVYGSLANTWRQGDWMAEKKGLKITSLLQIDKAYHLDKYSLVNDTSIEINKCNCTKHIHNPSNKNNKGTYSNTKKKYQNLNKHDITYEKGTDSADFLDARTIICEAEQANIVKESTSVNFDQQVHKQVSYSRCRKKVESIVTIIDNYELNISSPFLCELHEIIFKQDFENGKFYNNGTNILRYKKNITYKQIDHNGAMKRKGIPINNDCIAKQRKLEIFYRNRNEKVDDEINKVNNNKLENNHEINNKYHESYIKLEDRDRNDRVEEGDHAVGCGCSCPRCYSPCWPKDWLAVDHPEARIISINYTSDPHMWRPFWIKKSERMSMVQRAELITQMLLDIEVGCRPIVWVGHSKGGLYIKEVFVKAFEFGGHVGSIDKSGADRRQSIWSQTAGFMMYSVPHRGSHLARLNIGLLLDRSTELLEMIENNPYLLELHERWRAAYDKMAVKPRVRSIVETSKTWMVALYLRIVTAASADMGVGLLQGVSLDHREICKPSSRRCILYTELLHLINESVHYDSL